MSQLKPATRALFTHTLAESAPVRPFFREFFSHEENRPDVIFRFNYYMIDGRKLNLHPRQFEPYQDVFWYYLP
jgi:hypothetical protein